jgi:signal transduction histidine kinase
MRVAASESPERGVVLLPSLPGNAVVSVRLVRFRRPLLLLADLRASRRVPLGVLISVVTAAAALSVVGAFDRALGLPLLFPAFVGIVFVSAEVAGTSYGILTMAIFGAGYVFFFLEPRRSFGLENPEVVFVLVAYAIAGFVVASIGGAVRKAYARVREEHRAVTTMHEQREDLLKTLTHDIRTPLGVIKMNAALLARDPADPAVVLRRGRAIERSAASVAGMLRDLVDTVHLESGQLGLERRAVDLASFAVELKSRLEEALPVERVDLAIATGLPAAYVDPQRFERILVNLVSNALKYAPPPTRVVLGAAAQERDVVVSVADRGPGISARDLPHIFEKYYRASGARKREGLGIGLYSTRLLVQAHGGRIWVDSALGKGTTFHVALPIAPSEKRASEESTLGQRLRIAPPPGPIEGAHEPPRR